MKVATIILVWLIPVAGWAELSEPIRVIEDDVPHAAPIILDVDGDGVCDLIVGLYRDDPYTGARVQLFCNVGTNASPKYEQPVWLQAGGRDASVDEFCYTGFGPQFVDFNGDGLVDLVSGSRDGRLHVFARRDDGAFRAVANVVYASGDAGRKFQYNSRVFLHDWDQDGDHNLLATRRKAIWLVPNEGTANNAKFGTPKELLTLEPGQESFSSCAVADWDSDGRLDLVAGLWDGSVVWYRNESKEGRTPKLGPPDRLVEPGASRPVLMDDAGNYVRPQRPAGHIRIFVADYNDDGLVDLLVGDAWQSVQGNDKNNPCPKPTANQLAQRSKAYQRESILRREFAELQRAPGDETREARLVRVGKIDALRPECAAAWQACHSSSLYARHGSVWFFRRVEP